MNGVGYGITPFMGSHGILARSSGGGVTPFVNEYSMSFDGVDEYFNLGNPSSLQISGNFSISVWIKYSSIIQAYAFSGCGNKYGIYVQSNLINLQHRDTGNVFRNVTSTSTFNDNKWHHVLGVNDGTNLKLYIDGTLNNSNSLGGANITSTLDARIGSISTATGWEFSGNIDEVSIWNSDQSSNASSIYNGGVPTDLSSLSPVSWWRMGDGDSFSNPGGLGNWTLTDNGSGGNDATSVNMEEGDRLPISPSSFSLNSFSFDGVDEYLSISANSNLQISDTFTISHWVKFTSTSQMYVTNFANKYGTFVQNGYAYLIFRNLSNTQILLQSTSTINDGNWHNIIVVKTTSTMAIYIDGVLDANNTNGATGITSTSSNAIGALFNGAIPFQGTIDEVGLWNSDQSSNVATIFNNGTPNDISSLSPISWWRMGEEASWSGSAWTLTDQGSGGNNATSVNMEEGDKTGDQPYVI